MVWHPPSEWPRFHEIPRGFGCLELYVRLTDDVEVKLKWLLSLRVRPMAVEFKKGKIWRLWPGWCVNQSFLGMPEGLIRSLRGVFHAFSHISHHSTASGPHNQNKGWCTTKTEYVVNRSVWCCFCKTMHWPLLRLTISEIVLSWRRRGLGSMMFHDDVMTTMISDSFGVELRTAYWLLYPLQVCIPH